MAERLLMYVFTQPLGQSVFKWRIAGLNTDFPSPRLKNQIYQTIYPKMGVEWADPCLS